jgi:hypothetical protein
VRSTHVPFDPPCCFHHYLRQKNNADYFVCTNRKHENASTKTAHPCTAFDWAMLCVLGTPTFLFRRLARSDLCAQMLAQGGFKYVRLVAPYVHCKTQGSFGMYPPAHHLFLSVWIYCTAMVYPKYPSPAPCIFLVHSDMRRRWKLVRKM